MQLALPLVRGLVSQGVSLLDLGPFHTDTQQILDLHDQATSAYSEIITGCGVAPGLTNLVVHEAARAFDSVDSVVINSLLVGDAYLLPSAISDRAGETTVPVAIVDGRPTKLDPAQVASRTDEVDFRRFGTARVTPISHAEPATLARSLGVPAVMFRSGHPCTEDAGIALLRSLGLLSDQTPPGSTLTALAATKAAMSLHGVRSFNAKLITLHGIRHGAAALDEWFFAAEAAGMSATGHLSGFVAAQAVRQVLGRPRRPGAWAPEQALDPAAMIAAVRHHDQFIIEPAPARAGSQEYA
jgi:saccharopine dehydrogenase-like NADP-dependent oxidoreductase